METSHSHIRLLLDLEGFIGKPRANDILLFSGWFACPNWLYWVAEEKAGDAVFSKRFFADCVIASYVANFDRGFKEKFKLRFGGAKK